MLASRLAQDLNSHYRLNAPGKRVLTSKATRIMSETVYKGVEIVGTSDQSFSHAIEIAVRRARATLRDLSWFVVAEQRGGLQQGRLEYQVTLRVFFHLEEAAMNADEPQTETRRNDAESGSDRQVMKRSSQSKKKKKR